jgi:hypothetical protein
MRLVVLQIDDDTVAEKFAEDITTATSGESLSVPLGSTIVGSFKQPTNFCDPSDGHRGRKTEAGWTRGKKYGWWVCGKCKKPTEAWAKNLNAVLSSSRNLLSPNHTLGAAPLTDATEATTDKS